MLWTALRRLRLSELSLLLVFNREGIDVFDA